MPVKPGLDIRCKERVQVTRKPLMIRHHRRGQILGMYQRGRRNMMCNHHAVLVCQRLFQERNTGTVQSIVLNVIKLGNLINVLNLVSGVGHVGPQGGPDKTIALVDFVTVPQEGHVLEGFKILIQVLVCLVHGIVIVFMITRNHKCFHEIPSDKLHERVILGLTMIANVPRQDTDFVQPGRDLCQKGVHVFDVFQMEVGHVANLHLSDTVCGFISFDFKIVPGVTVFCD